MEIIKENLETFKTLTHKILTDLFSITNTHTKQIENLKTDVENLKNNISSLKYSLNRKVNC